MLEAQVFVHSFLECRDTYICTLQGMLPSTAGEEGHDPIKAGLGAAVPDGIAGTKGKS